MSETSEEYVDQFESFFKEFRDDSGSFKLRDNIERMPLEESRSLIVDYNDLRVFDPALAELVEENPEQFINSASTAVKNVMKVIDPDSARAGSNTLTSLKSMISDLASSRGMRSIRSLHIKDPSSSRNSLKNVSNCSTYSSEISDILFHSSNL